VIFGPDRLQADLVAIGFAAARVAAPDGTPFVVVAKFVVPCGRFVGRIVDLGLQATPDFPLTVATAIHVRCSPHLLDISDTIPGKRNITNSVLGSEWRYWSHNLGWSDPKTARRLISKINKVFHDA
jgi:hypothetical protein